MRLTRELVKWRRQCAVRHILESRSSDLWTSRERCLDDSATALPVRNACDLFWMAHIPHERATISILSSILANENILGSLIPTALALEASSYSPRPHLSRMVFSSTTGLFVVSRIARTMPFWTESCDLRGVHPGGRSF